MAILDDKFCAPTKQSKCLIKLIGLLGKGGKMLLILGKLFYTLFLLYFTILYNVSATHPRDLSFGLLLLSRSASLIHS